MPLDPNQFLTHDEAVLVDAALLTSQEKFTTRVAIYSLRTLKRIAEESGEAIATLSTDRILAWIEQDVTEQQETAINTEFTQFFARLVVSSLKPLRQASAETGTTLETLSLHQVIAWFEHQSKARQTVDR